MRKLGWALTACLLAWPSKTVAQPYDHLECYRAKDPHKFNAVVNMLPFQDPPFPVGPGCKLTVKGRKFCVPVQKQLLTTDAPAVPLVGQDLVNDFICYKVKCSAPAEPIPDVGVLDQFGPRTMSKFKVMELCAPAVKIPTTTTTTTTTTSTVTTTTLCDQDCPEKIRFTLKSGLGGTCVDDTNCEVGFCDLAIGRCRTETELDLGWSGRAFDLDINDDVKLGMNLSCPGGGNPGPCGDCTVTGWNCEYGTCRCSNNNQTICTNAFSSGGDCGAGSCIPYASPPLPVSTDNLASCNLLYLAEPPSGTFNVDTGEANLDLSLRSVVHIDPDDSSKVFYPCPYCESDVTPCDGVPDGTCNGGLNHGSPCDAGGVNHCFPTPDGDGVSLDCFPPPVQNISGLGIPIELDPLTTATVSLPFSNSCDAPLGAYDCACGACSGDASIACADDADCGAVGAGTCTSFGFGVARQPNSCDTLNCLATASPAYAPDGLCDVGPVDMFCDGVTKPDGAGLIGCTVDADCDAFAGSGDCTISSPRQCFLDPIVAVGSGSTDPADPRLVSTLCMVPPASTALAASRGYPGPARVSLRVQTSMTCPSDPTLVYSPTVGFVRP